MPLPLVGWDPGAGFFPLLRLGPPDTPQRAGSSQEMQGSLSSVLTKCIMIPDATCCVSRRWDLLSCSRTPTTHGAWQHQRAVGTRGIQKVLVHPARVEALTYLRDICQADLVPRLQAPTSLALGRLLGAPFASGRTPSADLDFPACPSPMESAHGLSYLK